jgi:hypothetical protein
VALIGQYILLVSRIQAVVAVALLEQTLPLEEQVALVFASYLMKVRSECLEEL